MAFIAWGVTGAGHFLCETFSIMEQIAAKSNSKVTTFLTKAGAEVIRIYGLRDTLRRISSGGYYSEIITQENDGWSSPSTGRLSKGAYRLLVVSPASANTVAKLRYGIADTLVTSAVSQALRSDTPVLVLPTDQSLELVQTTLPCRVNRELCKGCEHCSASEACQVGALERVEGRMKVQLSKCIGCCRCLTSCPVGAVRFGEKIRIKPRLTDMENAAALNNIAGLTILRSPEELKEKVLRILEGSLS